MKSLLFFLLLALFSSAALAAGPVRHVVHFKFKDDVTPEQIQHVVDEFAALKKKIKVIESLEFGHNVSPEGFDKGFKHCWILSFKTEADRDTYLKHPDHVAFGALVKPLLADVMVVDFVPTRASYEAVPGAPQPGDSMFKLHKPMRSGIPKAYGAQKTG